MLQYANVLVVARAIGTGFGKALTQDHPDRARGSAQRRASYPVAPPMRCEHASVNQIVERLPERPVAGPVLV